jgi:type I restriction enzyme S subunit
MGNNNWIECKLASICDSIDYGYTASAKEHPIGPKLLRITDIIPGYINWKSVPFCNIDSTLINKYTISKGDIVIARTGASTGASIYIENTPKAVFASYLIRLRMKKDVDARFISYFLKSSNFWSYMDGVLGDKSAQPNASAKTITQVKIKLPPFNEQRLISSILGTLDGKIELNRQMNETLEGMARAIFKSWFVDFDPVRAKAEGRDTGLPDHISKLFPDNFQDSVLGQIPKGWETESLYETAKYINGAAFKNIDFSKKRYGLPVVKITELKNGITDQTKFTEKKLNEKYKIDNGDILFSWSGSPNTSIDTFIWTLGPAWLNQHIFRVIPHNQTYRCFLYYMLRYMNPIFIEIARDKQTIGLGHVTTKDLKTLEVCIPPIKVLNFFNIIVAPLYDKMYQNTLQSNNLKSIRDLLLPKLISGEIRIPDPEKLLMEAGI